MNGRSLCLLCGQEMEELADLLSHLMSEEHSPAEMLAFMAIHMPETSVVLDEVIASEGRSGMDKLLSTMMREAMTKQLGGDEGLA